MLNVNRAVLSAIHVHAIVRCNAVTSNVIHYFQSATLHYLSDMVCQSTLTNWRAILCALTSFACKQKFTSY